MSRDEDALRDLARAHNGIISWADARAAGFSPRSIHSRVDRGTWARVGQALVVRDLLVPGDAAVAWTLHLHAGTASIVSGPVAARLQGWDVPGNDHVIVNPAPIRPPQGMDLTVLRRSEPHCRRMGGLPPLVPRLDALADTLICRSQQGARDLIDRALQRRWIDAEDLDQVIAERSGPGRKGQPRLRWLRDRAITGSRSEAEHRMGLLLARSGRQWSANVPVLDADGRVLAEIDFADPLLKIAIEVDGRAFHTDRRSFERDRERQNLLVIRGWVILRFTWERIAFDPEGVLAEVMATVHQARAG